MLLLMTFPLGKDSSGRIIGRMASKPASKLRPDMEVNCKLWDCTCQGMSNKFGTIHGQSFGRASKEAKAWWLAKQCRTSPDNE